MVKSGQYAVLYLTTGDRIIGWVNKTYSNGDVELRNPAFVNSGGVSMPFAEDCATNEIIFSRDNIVAEYLPDDILKEQLGSI